MRNELTGVEFDSIDGVNTFYIGPRGGLDAAGCLARYPDVQPALLRAQAESGDGETCATTQRLQNMCASDFGTMVTEFTSLSPWTVLRQVPRLTFLALTSAPSCRRK